uniref:Uncharacterized protein n=1 Tax=Oryza nivara TaxID=4536 RepID=A0A0E0G2V6_ORYNI
MKKIASAKKKSGRGGWGCKACCKMEDAARSAKLAGAKKKEKTNSLTVTLKLMNKEYAAKLSLWTGCSHMSVDQEIREDAGKLVMEMIGLWTSASFWRIQQLPGLDWRTSPSNGTRHGRLPWDLVPATS